MIKDGYDVAQICKNGHIVTISYASNPNHSQDYCDKCGEETLTACIKCDASIRGKYRVAGVTDLRKVEPKLPRFCYKCGTAYPWTERALVAAKELAAEVEGLEPEELEKLNGSIDDLVKEGPQVIVATTRFKKLLKKAGDPAVTSALRDILVDVISESAKKAIWPGL
ncbi:DUF2321 domain-containing protein [Bacillus paramycoides]|uniref:DUF2321 domain-containing protein n=1 Tax=Bacillus paramycoides TaxID=2026194 RepID=UPI003D030DD5